MSNPDLLPGTRALTLPMPHYPLSRPWAGHIVIIRSAPITTFTCYCGCGWRPVTVQIEFAESELNASAVKSIGPGYRLPEWMMSALIPLPPDDEAYRLFSDNIVTVTIPNPNYKERACSTP